MLYYLHSQLLNKNLTLTIFLKIKENNIYQNKKKNYYHEILKKTGKLFT